MLFRVRSPAPIWESWAQARLAVACSPRDPPCGQAPCTAQAASASTEDGTRCLPFNMQLSGAVRASCSAEQGLGLLTRPKEPTRASDGCLCVSRHSFARSAGIDFRTFTCRCGSARTRAAKRAHPHALAVRPALSTFKLRSAPVRRDGASIANWHGRIGPDKRRHGQATLGRRSRWRRV